MGDGVAALHLHDRPGDAQHAERAARPEDDPLRPLGADQARPVAGYGAGQAVAAIRLHAVLLELQRHLGPVYRRLLRWHPGWAGPVLVFKHEISALDPDFR